MVEKILKFSLFLVGCSVFLTATMKFFHPEMDITQSIAFGIVSLLFYSAGRRV